MKQSLQIVMALSLVVVVARSVSGQDAQPDEKTLVVKPQRFEVELELKGTVEPASSSELKLTTKSWTQFVIEEVVEQGKQVKPGEVVIRFKRDEYERKLRDTRFALELAKIGFEEARLDLRHYEQTQPMDEELQKRAFVEQRDDYQYYVDVDRPQRIKSAEFSLKMAEASLENAQEELEQLEKMYKEDELTEESEEIVLKRARRAVESSLFSLESSRLRNERTVETSIPREDVQKKEALVRAELGLKKALASFPLQREKKKIEIRKSEIALEKQEREFNELKSDGEQLEVVTDIAGIVYYGQNVHGKWVSATGGSSRDLRADQTVPVKKVFMTIVDPTVVRVHVTVTEKDLGKLANGMAVEVTPTAFSDVQLESELEELSFVLGTDGTYSGHCEISNQNDDRPLLPGMTCDVKVVVYENDEALVIPASAITTKDDDSTVRVKTDAGVETRTVELGQKSGDEVEVVAGLAAGDRVILKGDE